DRTCPVGERAGGRQSSGGEATSLELEDSFVGVEPAAVKLLGSLNGERGQLVKFFLAERAILEVWVIGPEKIVDRVGRVDQEFVKQLAVGFFQTGLFDAFQVGQDLVDLRQADIAGI